MNVCVCVWWFSYKRNTNLAKKFPILKLSVLDSQIVREKWRISARVRFVVGVKSKRVWEHLNGGWIPVFSLVQSPRHGTNMAGAIIYAPHLFTCVIFVRAVHVREYAPRGKTGRCCALHLSKCRSVSDATFVWENDTFVHLETVHEEKLLKLIIRCNIQIY